ncbi:MAG: hypothetical protein WC488_04665 [Candidatus Micrarchaeia archaeon]
MSKIQKSIFLLVFLLGISNAAAPTVTLVSPEDGASINSTLPFAQALSWSVDDENLTTDGVNCTLYVTAPGGPSSPVSTTPTTTGSMSYEYSGDLSGTYDWYASCSDVENLTQDATPWSFVVTDTSDHAAPAVSLQSPANGSSQAVSLPFTQTLSWNVNDDRIADGVNCSLFLKSPTDPDFSSINEAPTSSSGALSYDYEANAYGTYYWYAACTDAAGNSNTTGTRRFSLTDNSDSTPPGITLKTPTNGTTITDSDLPHTVTLKWNVSDNNFSLGVNCSAYLKIPSESDFSKMSSQRTNSSHNLEYAYDADEYGAYSWYVNCTDTAGNPTVSGTWEFTLGEVSVEESIPYLVLQAPSNASTTETEALPLTKTFRWNVDDDNIADGVNCTLYVKNPLQSSYSNRYHTEVISQNTLTYDYAAAVYGVYSWYVSCTNSLDNTNTSSVWKFTLKAPAVDSAAPSVSLQGPANNSAFQANAAPYSQTLKWNVNDNNISLGVNCSLYMKSPSNSSFYKLVQLNSNSAHSLEYGYSAREFGNYSWYVECVDLAGNANTTLTWKFELRQNSSNATNAVQPKLEASSYCEGNQSMGMARVLNQSNAPLPSVKVKVAGNATLEGQTNSSGIFVFQAEPGAYTISLPDLNKTAQLTVSSCTQSNQSGNQSQSIALNATTVETGAELTVFTTVDGKRASAEFIVIDPINNTYAFRSDENGTYIFKASREGTYTFMLGDASTEAKALPPKSACAPAALLLTLAALSLLTAKSKAE